MFEWLAQWMRRSPLHVAQDVACVAMPELRGLLEFSNKLQEEKFLSGVPQTLHSFLVLQLAYVHDMLGILVATASNDGAPVMSVVARVAFDPSFNWVEYVNTLTASLKEASLGERTPIERVEIERLTNLLVASAHVFMPLRRKLASELRKAGVVWR
jgi:hypothetical protein